MSKQVNTVGEALVHYLSKMGIDTVFGIPGVHTIELYRGLAASDIRHITPRHEQSAGFMADGYFRASGKIAAVFVITGPGLTNCISAMMQAKADSIPMLVVSAVNESDTLGRGLGHLHELPDQQAVIQKLGIHSEHIGTASDLKPALQRIQTRLLNERPAPQHLQIPLDVMRERLEVSSLHATEVRVRSYDFEPVLNSIAQAKHIVIIAGGGSDAAEQSLGELASKLKAPVVLTINARGLLAGHSLRIPASPSLNAVRELLASADLCLVVGSELSPTDFDIYNLGHDPVLSACIRIDIDPSQLARLANQIAIQGRAEEVLAVLNQSIEPRATIADWGTAKVELTLREARAELSPDYQELVICLETIRAAVPKAILVGDSTQLIYAGNMFYGHDSPRGWFNSSVGYGALGYAIPAAIGAALAEPNRSIICIVGDGGAQFSLAELIIASEESLPITFLVWNNSAYLEIARAMDEADVEVVACHPQPPKFQHIAAAMNLYYQACDDEADKLQAAIKAAVETTIQIRKPCLVEVRCSDLTTDQDQRKL